MNVERLPDSYAKDSTSNNNKLLNINEQAIAELKADMTATNAVLDLENATGATLDLYGNMVGQKRGALNDTQYRYMIWTRVGINEVKGDYKSTIDILKRVFGCSSSDIVISDSDSACKIVLTKFPLEVLVNAGFSSTQAVEMIESLLPIGVTIADANFQGTFEMAADATTQDNDAGFGNIEQTVGGYLGLLLGDDDTIPILPL